MSTKARWAGMALACSITLGACADRDSTSLSAGSPEPSAVHHPEPAPLDWVDRLPAGAPPRIGYVVGHTFHAADGTGSALRIADRGVTWITRLGSGFLAVDDRCFEGTAGVLRISADGTIDPTFTGSDHQPGLGSMSGEPVVAADGATVWWVTLTPPETSRQDRPVLHRGDVATGDVASVRLDLDGSSLISVVGLSDDRVLLWSGWQGAAGTRWSWSPDEGLLRQAGNARATTGPVANPAGTLAVVTGRRWTTIVDLRTHQVLRTIEHSELRRVRWALSEATWEDDGHLLVAIERPHRAAIARIHVRSGRWELAVDWTPPELGHSA